MLLGWAGVLFLFCVNAYSQDISFRIIEQSKIEERFAQITNKNPDRAAVLREMFAQAGCQAQNYSEHKVRYSKLLNLICVLPGKSERRVVVTAHYDHVELGLGAIDNWSGASMLPSLFESLTNVPRNLTFVFVLTADEEKGLYGSADYVEHLTKEQRRLVVADVNIDSVGLAGPVRIWQRRADPGLMKDVEAVAGSMKIELQGVNIDRVGDTDSHPFMQAKIPVIDFHSLTADTLKLLHSKNDLPGTIDPPTYFTTFRLISVFLAYLDTTRGVAGAAQ